MSLGEERVEERRYLEKKLKKGKQMQGGIKVTSRLNFGGRIGDSYSGSTKQKRRGEETATIEEKKMKQVSPSPTGLKPGG